MDLHACLNPSRWCWSDRRQMSHEFETIMNLLNPSTTVCHLYLSLWPDSIPPLPTEAAEAWTTWPRMGLGCGGVGALVEPLGPTGIDKGMNEPLLEAAMINHHSSSWNKEGNLHSRCVAKGHRRPPFWAFNLGTRQIKESLMQSEIYPEQILIWPGCLLFIRWWALALQFGRRVVKSLISSLICTARYE